MPTRRAADSEDEQRVRTLDALAEYDEFCRSIHPKLRRMVMEDWDSDRIRKELAPYVAARVISFALAGPTNSMATLSACKDVLDRAEGKSVQRQEITQRYSKMSRQELSALALQKLVDAGLVLPSPGRNQKSR